MALEQVRLARRRDQIAYVSSTLVAWGPKDKDIHNMLTQVQTSLVAQLTDSKTQSHTVSESDMTRLLLHSPESNELVRILQRQPTIDITELEMVMVSLISLWCAQGSVEDLTHMFAPSGLHVWRWFLRVGTTEDVIETLNLLRDTHKLTASVVFPAPSVVVCVPELLPVLNAHPWIVTGRESHLATLLLHAMHLGQAVLAHRVWILALPNLVATLGWLTGIENGALEEWWAFCRLPQHWGLFFPGLVWVGMQQASEWMKQTDDKIETPSLNFGLEATSILKDVQTALQLIRNLNLLIVLDYKRRHGVDVSLHQLQTFVSYTKAEVTLPLCMDVDCTSEGLQASVTSVFWASFAKHSNADRHWQMLVGMRYDIRLIPEPHRAAYLHAQAIVLAPTEELVYKFAANWSDEDTESVDIGNIRGEAERVWPFAEGAPTDDTEVKQKQLLGTPAIKSNQRTKAARFKGKVLYKQPKFQKTLKKGLAGQETVGKSGKHIPAPHDIRDPEKRKKAIKQILAISFSQARERLKHH